VWSGGSRVIRCEIVITICLSLFAKYFAFEIVFSRVITLFTSRGGRAVCRQGACGLPCSGVRQGWGSSS